MARCAASSNACNRRSQTNWYSQGGLRPAERDWQAPARPTLETKMATTQLNPSEISELIKTRIEKVGLSAEARNEGTVTSVADGIVRIHGVADVMQGEMIELPTAPNGMPTYALALNLERD